MLRKVDFETSDNHVLTCLALPPIDLEKAENREQNRVVFLKSVCPMLLHL